MLVRKDAPGNFRDLLKGRKPSERVLWRGAPQLPMLAKRKFVVVSGTMGEERAVEILKAGATDYVLKSHLALIGPVVRRALRESAERAEHKRGAGIPSAWCKRKKLAGAEGVRRGPQSG